MQAASRMARTCLVVDACPTAVVEMAIVTTISNHGRSREGLDSSSQLAYECRPDSNHECSTSTEAFQLSRRGQAGKG